MEAVHWEELVPGRWLIMPLTMPNQMMSRVTSSSTGLFWCRDALFFVNIGLQKEVVCDLVRRVMIFAKEY